MKNDSITLIYLELGVGQACPKCKLGKGLREASVLELGWSGWEHYKFLHCDTCGAYFANRGDGYSRYIQAQSITSD